MCFFIWISVILQTFEIAELLGHKYSPLSMLRSPRPFIMIRCIRVLLKLSMPKGQLISKCPFGVIGSIKKHTVFSISALTSKKRPKKPNNSNNLEMIKIK
jgi:hypothetical protein